MSKGCQNVLGSSTYITLVPNLDCGTTPVLHRVTVAAAAIDATTVSITLDSAFTPSTGAYSGSSVYPLIAGTVLTVGAQEVVVIDNPANGTNVYNITTTATTVTVQPLKAAIAAVTAVETYFGLRLCLTNANLATDTTTQDNTTNCSEQLSTMINTSYSKKIDMSGIVASKDFAYAILQAQGAKLATFYFAIDYDRQFFTAGQVQVTDPSLTDTTVKNIVKWAITGQVQQLTSTVGSFVATAGALTALTTARARWGFAAPKNVNVNPLFVI